MGAIAAVLCAVGIIGLIVSFAQKLKAGRIGKAPYVKTGEAATQGHALASGKGALSTEGAVRCDQPVVSPVTGTPCLYWELNVQGTWKEGDSNKSEDYVKQRQAASFAVDDGSGPVPVVATTGGDFEPLERTFEETRKEAMFADLKSAFGKPQTIQFGQYGFQNPPMSKASQFTCTERVLKVQPRLFVLGKFEGGAIRSPSWTSLVLSHKTRDEVLGSAQKTAKGFLIGGVSALGVGVILGVVSMLIGGGKGGDGASVGKPVLAASSNGATLDANARPVAGFRRVAGASDAVTVAVRPGGALHVSELNLQGDGPCVGWTNREPTYRVHVVPGAGALDITATSSDDTTLIVNGPDNRWQCSDDANGHDPAIHVVDAAPGQYDVWVGSYSMTSTAAATLSVAASGGGSATAVASAKIAPAPAPATPTPTPATATTGTLTILPSSQGIRAASVCEQAYDGLLDMVAQLQKNLPSGGRSNLVPREEFVRACGELPAQMQQCMAPAYSMQHREECLATRAALDPTTVARVQRLMSPQASRPAIGGGGTGSSHHHHSSRSRSAAK